MTENEALALIEHHAKWLLANARDLWVGSIDQAGTVAALRAKTRRIDELLVDLPTVAAAQGDGSTQR